MMLADVAGIIGACAYLLAYALLQTGVLSLRDSSYTYLNILGGVALIWSLQENFNLGAMITQVAWLIFTVVGFLRNMRTNRTA
ncbi:MULTISPECIES: cyclic nucleotide-binding protein [Paracoccus]|uniref:Cyclic nucleotide-binding protein n=1 Tax=Paracoccus litorisediminis TaxID=2006130 RepID=A0A844HP56_9RHOB|nr:MULTISPECIES: cyclic nucleotide-binding protein [Paracoccus]MBD9528551.1 cyclic nucleotide-binding protein [Paracoccus sp. PAR01]MTH60838.1 cyclic nucleotide-binding protein [Paracoccus litorisediminis]